MPYKDPEKRRAYSRDWKKHNPKRFKDYMRKWHKKQAQETKQKVLEHYGGNPPRCSCCGETHIEFLTIDHLNGGGNKHKKAIKRVGQSFYRWLVQNNYPEGYRVQCYNCNLSRGHLGYCPHEREGDLRGKKP